MKTLILRVAFIVSIIFFWISNILVANSYFSVGWEYTISEYQRSVIKADITKKILERNENNKRGQDESDYVEYSSNDYYDSNSYNNDYSPYSLNQSYIYARAVPYTPSYSFQKHKSFYTYRLNNACKNIKNNYKLQKNYFTPELNRLIINKNVWYSLHTDRIPYYSYFLTYSNNYNVNRYNTHNTKAIIKWYIIDLLERNFNNLDNISLILENDISELKDRLDNCYNNGNLWNVDLLKKNLKTLYKIQDRVQDDKEILKDLSYYYNK